MAKRPTLTTSAGAPIGDNQNMVTAGPHGPALLQDYQLIEKLAHQNRERIPERTVHTKGWGAPGTFTVTRDITKYTKAKIFSEVGKKTEIPEADVGKHWYDPFDLTNVWPHSDYPLIEVAVMELNRNADNYFQEIELAAFSPSNIVPGASWSPDNVLQSRIFSYADAHRYRLGTHYEALPVNRPRCPVHHYHKNGPMRFFEPLTANPDEAAPFAPRLRPMMCLAALAVAFTVSQPPPAHGDQATMLPVPFGLQLPAGNEAFLEGDAIGTQDYICLPSGSGFSWTFFGPQAALFNEHDKQIITHFLSPNPFENGTPRVTWQDSQDTSKVWGKTIASVAVEPDAIPWLLVKVVGAQDGPTGGDALSETTFIQRLNTAGGVAPSTGCTQSNNVGTTALVPYSADYFFYNAIKHTGSSGLSAGNGSP
jgi:hypothetical protein